MGHAGSATSRGARAQTGKVKEETEVHGGQINDIRFSADGTHFVTASADMTAKLIDTSTLEARRPVMPEMHAMIRFES